MQSEIQVRTARFEDLPAILELVQQLAEYEKQPDAVTATLADYQKNFREGVFEVTVAELDGKIVGMMLYYLTWSTWRGRMLYLEDFVVASNHRRLGIGTRLFDDLLRTARDKDCVLIKWQVLDWNESALDFYAKFDAIIERDWWNGKLLL